MEIHKATISRTESRTSLVLTVKDLTLEIVLTEDKPNEVKSVFNSLLCQLKLGEFKFELEDNNEDLYFHICQEYISQLNQELLSIFKELQDYDLLDNVIEEDNWQ